jgi:hypothetical protein
MTDDVKEDHKPRFEVGDLVKKKSHMPTGRRNNDFDVGIVLGVFSSHHIDFGEIFYVHVLWQTEPPVGRAMTIFTQGCLEKLYDKDGQDLEWVEEAKQLDIRRLHDPEPVEDE